MNKQELIDKAVHSLSGVWPKRNANDDSFCLTAYGLGSLCDQTEFQQRSRELGYINGYRWGVEYNLASSVISDLGDIRIALLDLKADAEDIMQDGKFSRADLYNKFKITDERYKPAGTSYLVSEIQESKSNAENVSDWWDYEAQKAVALQPVGEKVEGVTNPSFSPFKCTFVGIDSRGDVVVEKLDEDFYRYKQDQITLMPLDHNRKAEAEKKRVVDAAYNAIAKPSGIGVDAAIAELYDAGFLRMPAE